MTTGATGSGRPRPLIKCVYLPVLQQSALVAEDREGGPAEPVPTHSGRTCCFTAGLRPLVFCVCLLAAANAVPLGPRAPHRWGTVRHETCRGTWL